MKNNNNVRPANYITCTARHQKKLSCVCARVNSMEATSVALPPSMQLVVEGLSVRLASHSHGPKCSMVARTASDPPRFEMMGTKAARAPKASDRPPVRRSGTASREQVSEPRPFLFSHGRPSRAAPSHGQTPTAPEWARGPLRGASQWCGLPGWPAQPPDLPIFRVLEVDALK